MESRGDRPDRVGVTVVFPYFGGPGKLTRKSTGAEASTVLFLASLSYASRLEPYVTYGIHCTTVQQEKHVLCRHVPQNHVTKRHKCSSCRNMHAKILHMKRSACALL